jgi:hypothetical protein
MTVVEARSHRRDTATPDFRNIVGRAESRRGQRLRRLLAPLAAPEGTPTLRRISSPEMPPSVWWCQRDRSMSVEIAGSY